MLGRPTIIITLNTAMDSIKLFASTTKVFSKKLCRHGPQEGDQSNARSLSRTHTQAAGRPRLEESRTFIGTPRGSAIDFFASGKQQGQAKAKTVKKEKVAPGEGPRAKKLGKDKKKKEIVKRDMRSKEKEARGVLERLNEIRANAVGIKKGPGKLKGEKKVASGKDIHQKMLLKKRLTLEDEDFGTLFASEQKSTKNFPGSPKEDGMLQNKLVIQRLKKCLDSRPLRQISDSKMKKSFKGELVNKIKVQTDKMARKASKDNDEGSSPAVNDNPSQSHRERNLRSKRSKEYLPEGVIDKLKTELSVSTEKRSITNTSPLKKSKDCKKGHFRNNSGKHSPHPRLGRVRKAVPQTTAKKEHNKSQERKPRATADGANMRASQNLKLKKSKNCKGTGGGPSHVEPAEKEKKKGLVLFNALSTLRSSEICKIKLATRTATDSRRPLSMSCLLGEWPTQVPSSQSDQHVISFKAVQKLNFLSRSSIQEKTDKLFESRPDFPDRRFPIPLLEFCELGTALYQPELKLELVMAIGGSIPERRLSMEVVKKEAKKSSKSRAKPRVEECMEDIPNLPLETSAASSANDKPIKVRVKPLIINRGTAGIYSTANLY